MPQALISLFDPVSVSRLGLDGEPCSAIRSEVARITRLWFFARFFSCGASR
jgi:hypothetical protein